MDKMELNASKNIEAMEHRDSPLHATPSYQIDRERTEQG